jgi:DNA ligase 1
LASANQIPSSEFSKFADICDAIKQTRSKLEKVHILSEYFNELDDEDLNIAATFLAGRIFPPGELLDEVNVGYSILWSVVSEMTNSKSSDLSRHYLRHGDLGSVAEQLVMDSSTMNTGMSQQSLNTLFQSSLTLMSVRKGFASLARAIGPNSISLKKRILSGMFSSVRMPNEAKYIVKILSGEMRIGLVEGLVEESVAKFSGKTLAEVRSANLILSDTGAIAVLAKHDRLHEAKLVPLHPTNFMLADSAPSAELVFKKFRKGALVSEFKYDGIRAQLHVCDSSVRIFSRNLEDVTRFFPEIEQAARAIAGKSMILDGEILAFAHGRPLSFQLLQRRLRKLKRSENDVPVTFLGFDLLYFNSQSLLNDSLESRMKRLRTLAPAEGSAIGFSQQRFVSSAEEISTMFIESKELGFEGLVVKDLASPYSPGRRGSAWVKLKKELDTLDVVIVATEFGHGKRAGVLSDYTFAVSDGSDLKVIGKAYSGLTDLEIVEMTALLKSITLQDQGYRRTVRPQVVLEVAFDAIQKSDRHDSGYALRFPRIKRIRTDKSVFQIDSIDRVKEIYEAQKVKV